MQSIEIISKLLNSYIKIPHERANVIENLLIFNKSKLVVDFGDKSMLNQFDVIIDHVSDGYHLMLLAGGCIIGLDHFDQTKLRRTTNIYTIDVSKLIDLISRIKNKDKITFIKSWFFRGFSDNFFGSRDFGLDFCSSNSDLTNVLRSEDQIITILNPLKMTYNAYVRGGFSKVEGFIGTDYDLVEFIEPVDNIHFATPIDDVLGWKSVLKFQENISRESFNNFDIVLFVSHPWRSENHPDPDGVILRQLKQKLLKFKENSMDPNGINIKKHFLISEMKELAGTMCADIIDHRKREKVGIWFDYSSMPQHPRNDVESHLFKEMLISMNSVIMSKHTMTLVLKDDSYFNRSWCVYEYILGSCSGVWDEQGERFIGLDLINLSSSERCAEVTNKFLIGTKVTNGKDSKIIYELLNEFLMTSKANLSRVSEEITFT